MRIQSETARQTYPIGDGLTNPVLHFWMARLTSSLSDFPSLMPFTRAVLSFMPSQFRIGLVLAMGWVQLGF